MQISGRIWQKISVLIVLPRKICFLMKDVNLNFSRWKFYSEHCLKVVWPRLMRCNRKAYLFLRELDGHKRYNKFRLVRNLCFNSCVFML